MDSQFHVFPYREEELVRGQSRRLPRPTVDVRLATGSDETEQRSLLDTGAPRCVFPRGVGIALNIDLPDPEALENPPEVHTLSFLGHDWQAVPHWVQLSLPPFEDLIWDAEVDIVIQEGLTYGLLGHEGFLNRWAVSFNAYNNYFVVEHPDTLDNRIPVDNFRVWQEEWPDYN